MRGNMWPRTICAAAIPGAPTVNADHPRPFVRSAGSGPVVLCFHANASSSSQWRALSDRLASKRTVVAVDSWNAGRSPAWTDDRLPDFDDEVDLIEPVLLEATAPVDLVGHSFGGAIALKAALRHPARVRSVAVYEPTVFWLVAAAGRPQDVQGIVDAGTDAAALVAQGSDEAAARRFIDFWTGPGAWDDTPPDRRTAPLRAIRFVSHWAHAAHGDRATLSAFSTLSMPVLVMSGSASPLSGRAPAALLSRTMSGARTEIFEGLGHMAPATHPDLVNAWIEQFLDEAGG
jgi:pimeloyl-ACP methyl ester carboxylesterase